MLPALSSVVDLKTAATVLTSWSEVITPSTAVAVGSHRPLRPRDDTTRDTNDADRETIFWDARKISRKLLEYLLLLVNTGIRTRGTGWGAVYDPATIKPVGYIKVSSESEVGSDQRYSASRPSAPTAASKQVKDSIGGRLFLPQSGRSARVLRGLGRCCSAPAGERTARHHPCLSGRIWGRRAQRRNGCCYQAERSNSSPGRQKH